MRPQHVSLSRVILIAPRSRTNKYAAAHRMLMAINIRIAAGHTVAPVHTVQSLAPSRLSTHRPLAAARIFEIFAAARRMRKDLSASANHAPLLGKNLVLLLNGPARAGPSALHRAACELGMRVAQVRYRQPAGSMPSDIDSLARTLGQMYDAINCDTLPAATVRDIGKGAGVPVYEGLGLDSHPVRMLADLMTLYEHPLPPAIPRSIRFVGDAGGAQALAFISAARMIGFQVFAADAALMVANDATFVIDATRLARWPMHMHTRTVDEARRREIHCSLMQVVLLDTIANACPSIC